jgi:hypothetical protein
MTFAELKVTASEILMGREKAAPLTDQLYYNLAKLLYSLNKFRAAWGKPLTVTSGYRPAAFNAAAGGAQQSAHLTLEACDFADPDGKLAAFCLSNQQLLADCGLWMEDPSKTNKNGIRWVHLQIRPATKRVFMP